MNKYLASFEVEGTEFLGRVHDLVDFGDVTRRCSTERAFALIMDDVFRESQCWFVSNEAYWVKFSKMIVLRSGNDGVTFHLFCEKVTALYLLSNDSHLEDNFLNEKTATWRKLVQNEKYQG